MGEELYRIRGAKVDELKKKLLEDDIASRANILFKDASLLTGAEGVYVRVIGTEEQLKRIEELLANDATKVTGEELERAISKMREEDERALSGLGSVFG